MAVAGLLLLVANIAVVVGVGDFVEIVEAGVVAVAAAAGVEVFAVPVGLGRTFR